MSGHSSPAAPALRGRGEICETLTALVEAIRRGESRVLLLRGEPGIGKTALLEYAIEIGTDARVERTAGVESEAEISFAGLHRLCGPMLDHADLLPAPQRDALRLVFGLDGSGEPNHLLVGLAVLGLFRKVAREQPLLCVVDDAQWLDQASARVLGFVARRLGAEPVALLLAGRESTASEFSELEELNVEGLSEADARQLLASVARVPLDEGVRERLIAESRGNPMSLTEGPHRLSPVELAGGLGLNGGMPPSRGLVESDRLRIEALPAETRQLLLVAAAEPLGDPLLLWRAAGLLGLGEEAAAPAEAAGLLELNHRVSFRTPLFRAGVYNEASRSARRGVHGALAEATDPQIDPDRHAWHRAQAASPPNDGVADDLVLSAGRARQRGGLGEAAAFLERAAVLTRGAELRAGRALAAAEAMHETGAYGAALELLAAADTRPLDELQRARLERLRGLIAFDRARSADAFPLLHRSAERLAPLDAALSRATYLDALGAATYAGRFHDAEGLAAVKRALRGSGREHGAGVGGAARFLMLACAGADFLWDGEVCEALSRHHVRRARREGALSVLPFTLTFLATSLVMQGEFGVAAARIEESDAIAASSGIAPLAHASLLLAAWRGRDEDAIRLFEDCAADATERGEGLLITVVDYATAVFHNGHGQYPVALAAARRASEHEDLSLFSWALPELVEAAARSGEGEWAAAALQRLSARARAGGTEWGLAMEARSRALLSGGDVAEGLYREAIERLGRGRVAVHLGRAHLVYGEWLRREGRRIDAREQLAVARGMFTAMGAEAFATRAGRELAATAGTARIRSIEHRDDLTAQEEEIARLARDGLSNPEIGTRLFISPRTVEYHLHKVFLKLGVHSRHELGDALAQR